MLDQFRLVTVSLYAVYFKVFVVEIENLVFVFDHLLVMHYNKYKPKRTIMEYTVLLDTIKEILPIFTYNDLTDSASVNEANDFEKLSNLSAKKLNKEELQQQSLPKDDCIIWAKDSDGKLHKYQLLAGKSKLTSFESEIIVKILSELGSDPNIDEISFHNISSFKVLKGICAFLNNNNDDQYADKPELLHSLISKIEKWANRSYEGASVELSFLIVPNSVKSDCEKINIQEVISQDFIATLTTSGKSFIVLDSSCNIINYCALKTVNKYMAHNVPLSYDEIINFIENDESLRRHIMISLTADGEILLIRDGRLLFAKRRGQWRLFNNTLFKDLIKEIRGTKNEVLSSVLYQAILDTSFAKTGGCLAVFNIDVTKIDDSIIDLLKQSIDHKDVIIKALANKMCPKYTPVSEKDKKKKYKIEALRKIIGINKNKNSVKIQSLARKLIQELLSIDGAMIIDKNGVIISVGSIVKIEAGSETGGRLAAAKSLAKQGLGIKISEDGEITGFIAGEDDPLFIWG